MLRAKALGQQFLFINKTCFFLLFEAEKRQVFYFGKNQIKKIKYFGSWVFDFSFRVCARFNKLQKRNCDESN